MSGLDSPPLPTELMYLWNEYCEIKKGSSDLTWESVKAYKELSGVNFSPWEVSIMMQLDIERRTNG